LIAYDPYIKASDVSGLGVELTQLGHLLRQSDVVTVHVVLTPETQHMLGYEEFRMMKRPACVVNTARGGAIHQAALATALQEGLIAGAALDVFEDEPLPMDDPLRLVDPTRLILTPHIVGNNYESRETGNRMAVASIIQLLRGQVPENVLNPDAISMWQERLSRLNA
jgi:phosphoglycerate dehydrogenase-like enzyme